MRAVIQWIEGNGLDDKDAAKALGIDARDWSQIRSGQIEKCTIDRLFLMLSKVGVEVAMTFKLPSDATTLGR